jgi:hypothetical protein
MTKVMEQGLFTRFEESEGQELFRAVTLSPGVG